ncbi:uncharacterized protein LOC135838749 [Planococcus citri]|uniref:uncharacterized protein LOC135838749 n=1 Tax=Planococcus citri TaxID=170843 RepID=UPI0031F9369F
MKEHNISMENCVADSFDGAANMSGQYQGVSAHLKSANPLHIHTWCQAHVLNLVMTESTSCTVPAISLFGLLQETCNFFRESYKRMLVFEGEDGNDETSDAAEESESETSNSKTSKSKKSKSKKSKSRKLKDIGKTRWSSKSDALTTVFGYYHQWDGTDGTKEETMMYLSIFSITSPVSKYLQTANLDYVQAWRQVDAAIKELKKRQRMFSTVYEVAETFVTENQKMLDDKNIDLVFEDELPEKRNSDLQPKKYFEVNVYNTTFNTAINSITERFLPNKQLYGDLECFDPKRFEQIAKEGLPEGALKRICELVPSLDEEKLKEELQSFVKLYPKISSSSWSDIYKKVNESDSDSTDIDEDDTENCTIAFENLYVAYKYLLTLPMTQVMCERVFSKLKLIKTKTRNTLSNETLETLLLMYVEREILLQVDSEEVIEKLCLRSDEFAKILKL